MTAPGETPPEDREAGRPGRRKRLTATLSGLVLTAVLALLGLALAAGLLAGLVFMAVALPLTTAAILAVLAAGGFAAWRAKRRR
ncbi:MAG: hypothetical protein WDZ84_11200 [Rhodovibrionaceae bacterium]